MFQSRSQSISFDFLTTIYKKLNLTSSQKLFVSEKQSQILHQILVTYIIEDKDVSLGLFLKKKKYKSIYF